MMFAPRKWLANGKAASSSAALNGRRQSGSARRSAWVSQPSFVGEEKLYDRKVKSGGGFGERRSYAGCLGGWVARALDAGAASEHAAVRQMPAAASRTLFTAIGRADDIAEGVVGGGAGTEGQGAKDRLKDEHAGGRKRDPDPQSLSSHVRSLPRHVDSADLQRRTLIHWPCAAEGFCFRIAFPKNRFTLFRAML